MTTAVVLTCGEIDADTTVLIKCLLDTYGEYELYQYDFVEHLSNYPSEHTYVVVKREPLRIIKAQKFKSIRTRLQRKINMALQDISKYGIDRQVLDVTPLDNRQCKSIHMDGRSHDV